MKREEFDTLLATISQSKGISVENLLADLVTHLNSKYGINENQMERDAIEVVKRKVMTTLYDMDNYSLVRRNPNLREIFGLDNYEVGFAVEATNELEADGLIEGGHSYTKLTPKGAIYVRATYK